MARKPRPEPTGWRAWFHPPKPSDDGTMALVDHLKELRYRVIVSALAVVVAMLVAWFLYPKFLVPAITWPVEKAIEDYQAINPNARTMVTIDSLMSPFFLQMRVAGVAGIIMACPVWLYQLWAFIAPGLLVNEKKYAARFLGSAIPLFLMGVALAYWITPKGFTFMLQFTPPSNDIVNTQNLSTFLDLELRILLVFGLAFLLPVVQVALNLMGVITAEQMAKFRTIAVFLCYVFGAVATPSGDPISMLALGTPMAMLYVGAEFICHRHDKAVERRNDPDQEIAVPVNFKA